MIGVQFEGVGSGEPGIEINKFVTGDIVGVDYDWDGEFCNTATQIQIWDGSGYTFYYYLNAHDSYAAGWCDDWGEYKTDLLVPGQAVWFWAKSGACTISTPGQVVTAEDTEIVCPNGKYMMAANFLPVELDLNNGDQVTFDGIVGTDYDWDGEFCNTAAQIQIWDGAGYTFYYYLNAHDKFTAGWCDDWGDKTAVAAIPCGRGFWAWAKTGAFTIHFWNK